MREFPKLLGKEFSTEGRIWNIGCADIVMSSAGWAMITAPKGEKSNFVAYTPGMLFINLNYNTIFKDLGNKNSIKNMIWYSKVT